MAAVITRPLFAPALFAALVMAAAPGNTQQDDSLQVSHQARALQPGEVVLLRVSAPDGIDTIQARVFGKTFQLARVEQDWEGLVGIDLNTKPGPALVEIVANGVDRAALTGSYPLRIEPKHFPTRRLTVEPRFVTPPPEVSERIAAESRLLGRVLTTVSPRRLWSGPLTRPVPGIAISSFGKRSVFNGQPRSPHTGADFRAAEGTPVVAPAAGTIVLAQELYYAGNAVIVDHGLGLLSMMAHLSRIEVEEGTMVRPGDRLGLAGATGRVTGPHLHWAMRLAGTRVDPVSLLELLGE